MDIFCERIEQYFTDVMSSKSIVVCGYFNIDLLKQETHIGTKPMLYCKYGLGLHPLIDIPSRITTNSCTLIDNIFTNQTNYLVRTGLLINDISDHLSIFALCNYKIDKKKCDKFKYVRTVKYDNVL